jgi:hypothetical protein
LISYRDIAYRDIAYRDIAYRDIAYRDIVPALGPKRVVIAATHCRSVGMSVRETFVGEQGLE